MLKALRDWFVSVNFSAVLKPLLETENRAVSSLHFFSHYVQLWKEKQHGMTVSRSCLSITIDSSGKDNALFLEGQRKIFRLVGFSRK